MPCRTRTGQRTPATAAGAVSSATLGTSAGLRPRPAGSRVAVACGVSQRSSANPVGAGQAVPVSSAPGVLWMRLPHPSTAADDRRLEPLLDALNASRTLYPGTETCGSFTKAQPEARTRRPRLRRRLARIRPGGTSPRPLCPLQLVRPTARTRHCGRMRRGTVLVASHEQTTNCISLEATEVRLSKSRTPAGSHSMSKLSSSSMYEGLVCQGVFRNDEVRVKHELGIAHRLPLIRATNVSNVSPHRPVSP